LFYLCCNRLLLFILLSSSSSLPPTTFHYYFSPPPPPPRGSTSNMVNVRCNRCTTLGLQCRISPGFDKSICLECQTASVSSCMYPPSIRLTAPQSNTACIHCSVHHRKCVFRNATDAQCTRCSKRNLSCMFKMNGMFVFNFSKLLLDCCFTLRYSFFFRSRITHGSKTEEAPLHSFP
jgi:hypothetical protein